MRYCQERRFLCSITGLIPCVIFLSDVLFLSVCIIKLFPCPILLVAVIRYKREPGLALPTHYSSFFAVVSISYYGFVYL